MLREKKAFEQRCVAETVCGILDQYDLGLSAALREIRDGLYCKKESGAIDTISYLIHKLRILLERGGNEKELYIARRVCDALFWSTPLMPALEYAVEDLPKTEYTCDLFGEARREAFELYPKLSGKGLFYYLSTPRFTWSALTSMLPFPFTYDPKGFARNSSGLLLKDRTGIDWTVGPTPTVGNHLAPETEASLLSLKKAEAPYQVWIYVNLQSMMVCSERGRSRALLEASFRFPDHFRFASIGVDSPWYKECERWSLGEHRRWVDEQIVRAVSGNQEGWYFFSVREKEKEKWLQRALAVVNNACEMALGVERESRVFHELVVLGLTRGWQLFCAEGINRVVSTVACKECIDRAGVVHAALLWALMEADTERVKAVLWGRPLLSRYRLVEKARTRGFEALCRAFASDQVRSFLLDV